MTCIRGAVNRQCGCRKRSITLFGNLRNKSCYSSPLVDSSSSALVLEALINGYDDEPDPIEFKVDVVQAEE